MRDSERYTAQAETVMRMAAQAANAAERQIYESIAEGWRRLADETRRSERRHEGARGPDRDLGRPRS